MFSHGIEKPIKFYPFIFWRTYIKWGERDESIMLGVESPGGEAEHSVRAKEMVTRKNGKQEYLWTQYNNYGVVLDGQKDWFVLSCFRTNIQSSRRLNTMIMRKQPIFSSSYIVETRIKDNKLGKFFVYYFDNDGYITDKELFERLRRLNEEVTLIKDNVSMAAQTPVEDGDETKVF